MVRVLPWLITLGLGAGGVAAVVAADAADPPAGGVSPAGLPAAPAVEPAAPAPTPEVPSPAPVGGPIETAPSQPAPPVPPVVGRPVEPSPGRVGRPRVDEEALPRPPGFSFGLGRVPDPEATTTFVGPPIEAAGPVVEGTGWENSLAAREVALVRAQIALNQEMAQVRELQAQVEDRWAEAERARRFAEEACGAAIVARPGEVGVVPPTIEQANERVDYVASVVKKMKPEDAAALLQQWDDALAVRVLAIVSARTAAPIVSKMPPEVAGRLTRRMATGRPTLGRSGALP